MVDLWLVLLGQVLDLVGRHFEVVLGVVLGPLEAGFRCVLLDGRLVLLRGQLRWSWVIVGCPHSSMEQ
jgi:hypothetical protein